MSLAWIAAVIRPEELPSTSDDLPEHDRATSELAELVRGQSWRTQLPGSPGDGDSAWPSDPALRHVSASFEHDSISRGVAQLAATVSASTSTDVCRTAALALLTSCAASELEDYETAIKVLESAIELCGRARSEDARFAMAFLVQQQAFRLRDLGKEHGPLLASVLDAVEALDIDRCTPFQVRPSVADGYTQTVGSMADALHSAAQSLQVREFGEPLPPARGAGWNGDIDRLRGESLAGLARRVFNSIGTGSSRPERASGPVNPFFYALRWELLGHRRAYESRADLAHARLADLGTNPSTSIEATVSAGEVIRLLRHAAEVRELEIAVRWIKTNGPLAALAEDARRIIRYRNEPSSMRGVELHVLREAADLLSPAERAEALASVAQMLDRGVPINAPGRWEAPALRTERAWLALAALADSAAEIDAVGYRLLDSARTLDSSDDLTDQALGSAIRQLDWSRAKDSLKQAWLDWLRDDREHHPRSTITNLERALRAYGETADYPLQAVAKKIDGIILDIPGDHSLDQKDFELVADALKTTRRQAAQGMSSFGGIPEADVAAALIIKVGATGLWDPLAAYLTDPRVVREHKRSALDRIASAAVELPESVAATFAESADHLLHQASDPFGWESIDPFPAGLRLLAAHRLIPTRSVIGLTSALMEQSDVAPRREAARTLALLLSRNQEPALFGMTLHLSYDSDALVRGYAGSALAATVSSDAHWSSIASDRVTDLLQADGTSAPLGVLRALSEGAVVPDVLLPTLEGLAANHVSTRVRRSARQLLRPRD